MGKDYKFKNGKWCFLVDIGDGGILKDNSWYEVINKDIIKELNTLLRKKKLERILTKSV